MAMLLAFPHTTHYFDTTEMSMSWHILQALAPRLDRIFGRLRHEWQKQDVNYSKDAFLTFLSRKQFPCRSQLALGLCDGWVEVAIAHEGEQLTEVARTLCAANGASKLQIRHPAPHYFPKL